MSNAETLITGMLDRILQDGLQKARERIQADARLLPNQKLAALVLFEDGGRLTRLEIAERINSHGRTMSRIMGRLVDLGLVDETRDGMTSAKSYRWIGEDK